jgi:hypothetical protein
MSLKDKAKPEIFYKIEQNYKPKFKTTPNGWHIRSEYDEKIW